MYLVRLSPPFLFIDLRQTVHVMTPDRAAPSTPYTSTVNIAQKDLTVFKTASFDTIYTVSAAEAADSNIFKLTYAEGLGAKVSIITSLSVLTHGS